MVADISRQLLKADGLMKCYNLVISRAAIQKYPTESKIQEVKKNTNMQVALEKDIGEQTPGNNHKTPSLSRPTSTISSLRQLPHFDNY